MVGSDGTLHATTEFSALPQMGEKSPNQWSEIEVMPVVELKRARSRERLTFELSDDAVVCLGRAPTADIVIDDESLLDRHATFTWDGDAARVAPCDGASVAVNGEAVSESAPLQDGDWIILGGSVFTLSVCAPEGASQGGEVAHRAAAPPSAAPAPRVVAEPAGGLEIGRLPESGICIDSPIISRRHARLVRSDGGAVITDLGSTNGTWVNGVRVEGAVALEPGARVEFGSFAYTYDGTTLREVAGNGQVRLEVRGITRIVKDAATGQPKTLLHDVSFAIEPGEFVGVFGTSGSGKSTLLDALNGRRRASEGAVLYNGADLYGCFDQFRASIGYVPQQDIVHRKITIRRALGYAARLRLPPDTSDGEIEGYVASVLDRVGLADKADQPIDTPAPLSGGQLKRVSLAVELVSNPAVVFLDEVTSGLDAGTDKRMMRLFAELANEKKTIVCVTHTLENIDVCHLVVLMHRGRLVFFGPPAAAADHFRLSRLSDVYDALESEPAEVWEERFASSALHRTWVEDRVGAPIESATSAVPTATVSDGSGTLRQAVILTRRYVDLIASDRKNLLITLLQAPLIGLVIGLVFDTSGSPAARASGESQVAFIMVISAIWFGCLNSAREIVKELPVYQRERAINLRIGSYLLSKLGPLAIIGAFQTAALLATVTLILDLSGSTAVRAATLFLSGLAATAMGLTVSALANTNDKAIAAVPMLLIPQVVLADAIVKLTGVSAGIAKATMISFWSFAAMKRSLGDEVLAALDPFGNPVVTVDAGSIESLVMLGIFFIVFSVCAGLALKLKDSNA